MVECFVFLRPLGLRLADYAVRAVLHLAQIKNGDRAATSVVAKEQRIPPSFLAKIICAIGAGALTLVKDYIEKQGGLDAVVKRFQDSGFKRQVDSWISTGKNEALSSIEVGQAIGIEKIKKLAEAAGVDVNKARDLLAEYLPIVIDKATPEGKLPPKNKA